MTLEISVISKKIFTILDMGCRELPFSAARRIEATIAPIEVGVYYPLQGEYFLTEEHRIPTLGTSNGYHAACGTNLLSIDKHPSAGA